MAPHLKNIRFGRRKSQGNSIDEGSPTAPTSSFRVIPREDATRKSTGNALDLRKAATFQPTRQPSYEYDSGSSNRGSNSSTSTATRSHLFDNPNTRFSSTSTLQSPVEAVKKDRSPSPHFLKLGDDFDSDWSDLFSNMDKQKSGQVNDSGSRPLTLGRVESEPVLSNPPKAFANSQRPAHPSPPLGYGQRREMTASPPTQWAQRSSTDRLMSSPDLGSADSPTDDEPPPPPPKHTSAPKDSKPYSYGLLSSSADMLEEPPTLGHTASVRSQNSFTRSGVEEDADAAFVQRSVRAMRASTVERSGAFESSPLARKEMNTSDSLPPPMSRPLNNSSDISLKTTSSTSSVANDRHPSPLPSGGLAPKSDSTRSTPRASSAEPAAEEVGMLDPEIMQAIQQANDQADNRQMLGLSTTTSSRPAGARVMSMADFNRAKANMPYTISPKMADHDSDDGYEDDDDDPQIQAQKRRLEAQKEAQHAVWRQKMKKAIGDQSSLPPMRPDFTRANQSAPSLMFNGEAQPEEEDDDVPLAILQAHNFPGKSKTPDPRMSQQSYVGIQDRPGSPSRTPPANQRGSQLPVFARRLPQDPYFGASDLSTPANRDSMAFNKGRAQSAYGGASGPPPGVSPVPGVPPGGLVGVIASEEHARGARRGSPNAQPGMGFNMPGVGPQGAGMPMPMMPMGPGNPTSQQDMVRNQQMLELMQQNSFMMKEMMEMRAQMQMFQMVGGPMPTGPQGMPMSGLPPQNRPTGMADPSSSRRSVAPSTMYGRTMSFMGPAPDMFMNQQAAAGMSGSRSVRNMPVGNFGPLNDGYTPSIAPSERSNVGQPSRYKPVNFGDGASTVTAGSTPRLSQAQINDKKKSGFLSAVVHPGRKSVARARDDDDEEEWGTVRRRR